MTIKGQADLAIIGAGIVGLAHALAAVRRGMRVVLFERSERTVGASVRNFGLVWPVGQPEGERHERALRSRAIWTEVAAAAGLYLDATGSLHLAYHEDELAVLAEFASTPLGSRHGRVLLRPADVLARSRAVKAEGLRGALWSPTEATVDPRQAIRKIPGWLESAHGVGLQFGTTVRRIELPRIETTAGVWQVAQAIVCSGADFETLFPETFAATAITRCKLQMLRTLPQPGGWRLGPALCAGLTLAHYDSFKTCRTLPALVRRFAAEQSFCVEHGIHVLLSQTGRGELTIGDSHQYGATVEPFDREEINVAIMACLQTFAVAPTWSVAERWHGVYPKLAGASELIAQPAPGVWIVNALGGAGMTLSFGLAEEVVAKL